MARLDVMSLTGYTPAALDPAPPAGRPRPDRRPPGLGPLALFIALLLLLRPVVVRADAGLPETMYFAEDGARLVQDGQPVSGLYDETVLRTFELRFAQADWWEQLTANYQSEEEIPADLVVNGVTYPNVGVRFKGMTSYRMTGNSQKKSFNISVDFQDADQRLMGYRTLNLNNAASDPTFMREVLYFDLARRYIPCPKASFVKLVINGENWGVYVHAQQLNADMIEEWFASNDGTRWKAGGGGMGMGDGRGGDAITYFEEWATSDQASDLDGDGQITEQDYQLFRQQQTAGGLPADSTVVVPPAGQLPGFPGTGLPADSTRVRAPQLTFAQWAASAQARDLDGDGQITEADYQLFRQQAAGGLRVDSTRARQPGGQMPGTGGGGVVMFGGGDGALTWLGSDTAAYADAYDLRTDHSDDPWAPLIHACDVLNNTSLEVLASAADSVLAVDRWLWFLAVESICTDEDSYLTKGWDYQFYYEPESGRIHPLEFDGNESFITRDADLSPFAGEGNASRPVISRLLAIPALRQRYLAHVRTILDESFDWAAMGAKVAAYRALIEAEVQADPRKLYSYDEFVSGLAALERFVAARRTYLLTHAEVKRQAPQISAVTHALVADVPAAKVGRLVLAAGADRVTAQVTGGVPANQVLLHWATGTAAPFAVTAMFDDDAHGDGAALDGLFAGEIPAFPAGSLVRYYVEARAADSTASFAPAGAENDVFCYQVAVARLTVAAPVVINELMAANDSTVQDPQGQYEDWIELHNTTDHEVDLSGMYLSDRADDLRQWSFPDGTRLAPGAYLLVWADGDEGDEPGLHAAFRLSADGEVVYLVDADARGNALLDTVSFAQQEPNRSYGRVPDGEGTFQPLTAPTPSAANSVSTAVLDNSAGAQPARFSLEQNYPNPFNSGTVIRFSLPPLSGNSDPAVELAVFDLLGQEVASLAPGAYAPGVREARWDGRDGSGRELASGVYVYRLRAGGQVECRRMLLLR